MSVSDRTPESSVRRKKGKRIIEISVSLRELTPYKVNEFDTKVHKYVDRYLSNPSIQQSNSFKRRWYKLYLYGDYAVRCEIDENDLPEDFDTHHMIAALQFVFPKGNPHFVA